MLKKLKATEKNHKRSLVSAKNDSMRVVILTGQNIEYLEKQEKQSG